MIHKLRQKFIAIAMASVTLVLLLAGVSINAINWYSTHNALNSTLDMICENEGTVPQFSEKPKPGSPRREHFTEETPYSTRYFVLRYAADGTLTGADMKHIAAVTEADAEHYLAIARTHGEGFGLTGSYKFRVVKTGTDKYMAVFLDCYDELHTLQTFAAVSMLVIACCVVLVFLLVLLLSKRAIAPTLQAMEKQKQFITDASHELKTPLTVINTSLKVLEMDVGKNKWVDKIQGQTDKLTRLVGDLVTLSRLDEAQPPLHLSDFDVSAAAADVAASFQELACSQGHRLETELAPDVVYHGDEGAVRQLISILLDNAVKYADAGGAIRLELKREKKGVVLLTENPCVSLDRAETERLFDRFYRVDKSRCAQTPGFGVGLSIAKSIVETHRGSITAKLLPDGVIQFSAALP